MNDEGRPLSDIEDAIVAMDWKLWTQPAGNSGQRIPWELRRILSASDEDSSWNAVMGTEYAFGNAEAGTYYPAIVPAIPILGLIAQHGEEWAKLTAVEILTDWLFSFYPEPKQEKIIDSDSSEVDLQMVVDREIMKLRPTIEHLAFRSNLPDPKKVWLREILLGMDEMQEAESATKRSESLSRNSL